MFLGYYFDIFFLGWGYRFCQDPKKYKKSLCNSIRRDLEKDQEQFKHYCNKLYWPQREEKCHDCHR